MITFFSRILKHTGIAALGLTAILSSHAQVTTNNWVGSVDSNYLNAANWSSGTAPGALSDILLTTSYNGTPVTNRVLNLNYTGTGDFTQQIYGIQNGVNRGHTLNLSGTANGRLIYSVVGRGTHPYLTAATSTSTGSSANRLPFYINAGPYTTIIMPGSTGQPSPGSSTSGFTYALFTLTNAIIDGSMIPNGQVNIGGLTMDAASEVRLGNWGMNVSSNLATGAEELWAGHIYQNPGATGATATTNKWGTGTTRVTATGVVDHPGMFNIRAAQQYLVDGVHNGPIGIDRATSVAIGGTGTINGAVSITSGSSIAPAGRNAVGNFTINGDVSMNGSLSFELFGPAQYDHLQLNGTLTLLAGSSLAVGITDTFPLQPATYRVMNFTGLVGAFGVVTLPSSQGLGASYVMGPNYLDIVFTQLAYGTNPLMTKNYGEIAKTIDAAVLLNKVPGNFLENLNRQPSIIFFKEVLDQLTPTCYYGWYPAAVTRTGSTVSMIEDRLSQKGERVKGSIDAYVMTSRQESSIDQTELADYTNFDTISTFAGVDMLVAPGFTMGGMFEYAKTRTDLNQLNSSSETDSLTLGLYAQARRGAFEVQVAGFGGFDQYESKRNVERTKLAKWANSDTKGQRLGGSMSASYTKKFKWVEVSPNIGGFLLNWSVNEFQEKEGAEANMRILEQKETAYAARVGLRLAQTYTTKRGTIRPFVNLSHQRDFGGETRKIKAELFGAPLTTKVPAIQKSGMRIDFGLDWSLAEKLSAQVRYVTEAGGAADESLGIRGGLNVAF